MKENNIENYVMMNPYLFSLLKANEFVVFAEIIRLCNINNNFVPLGHFKEQLNMSINTIRKTIDKLINLNLISRCYDYNIGCHCYSLNLDVIANIYNKLNSYSIEERHSYCQKYIDECIE